VAIFVLFVQTLLLAVEVVVIVVMLSWRYPRAASTLVVLLVGCVVLSPATVAAILFYGPIGVAAWWAIGLGLLKTGRTGKVLALWRGLVGRRLHASWRRWTVYERRWQKTLERHHLTEPRERGLDKVPRYRVRTGPFGDTLRVKVLRGQYARDFTGLDGETAKALAKAFNARECRVSDEPQSDWITLWLPRGKDPLATPVPFPRVPKTTGEVDLTAVPIGVDEKGRQVKVPVLGSHLLIASITGGGKGSAIYSVLLHLVPFIREGSVRVWIADPKRGVELAPISALAYRFEDRGTKEIGEMLADAVKVMDASADRLKLAKLRKLSPTPDHPLNVVLVDELGRLSDDKECQAPLKELINVGRAPGVSVIGALQTPTKDVAKFRDEIPVKWVGRMESKEYVRLCLGREAVLNGAAADEIPMSMPGAGYLKIDRLDDDDETTWLDRTLPWRRRRLEILSGRAMEPTRMRCYHVTDELIAEVNAMFLPDDEAAIAEFDEPDGEPVGGDGEEWDEDRVARDRRGRFAGAIAKGRAAGYDVDDPSDPDYVDELAVDEPPPVV
jgi:S-DNA-T family DNA segregation ATPase FtsK/SpoIIIE